VSSHTGRIITAKKGLACASEEARAWQTALSMSSGSYSGLAVHEPVHLYEKASRMAPNASSALKAEQYDMSLDIEQGAGLTKRLGGSQIAP